MKRDELRAATKTALLDVATERDIPRRHSMTKDQLIEALVATNPAEKKSKNSSSKSSRANSKSDHSSSDLSQQSKKQLLQLAEQYSIAGAKSMTKQQLVEALAAASAKEEASKKSKPKRKRAADAHAEPVHAANRRTKGSHSIEDQVDRSKYRGGVATRDLSQRTAKDLPSDYGKDRIVTMVRDPYWLHVYWELTRKSVERTAAALGQHWYSSKPVLRVLSVTSDDTSSTSETLLRDIEIHGGVNNWYIDVQDPPGTYRVDIGYLTAKGRFYVLARSNTVTTPRPGMSDEIDTHWPTVRDECERIYAMSGGADPSANSNELRALFEERLRRPMSSGVLTDFGSGALGEDHRRGFHFELDAELIVYGRTERTAKVTLQGEPLQLRPDGTFTVRFGLPDGRQIIPAVSQSPDGIEERTIILAIERNTKELEPMIHDGHE